MRHLRLAAACALACALGFAPTVALAGHINLIRIDGSVNPASSDFLQQAVETSANDGALALIIELDTPGGLLSATKDMVQALLNAKVPVIVYVSPQGAWAASAGAFITMAAHIAAMAPGTSIGAASPVGPTGSGGTRDAEDQRQDVGSEKAEKFTAAFIEAIATTRGRNVEWARTAVREAAAVTATEALKLGVIDLIAENRAALLEQIEGREVEVNGEKRVLALAGTDVRTIEMTWTTRIFDFLSNPEVAFLLFMAGALGLYTEFNNPGLLFPGIAGAICLLLAAIAFQILPFSWVGMLLLVVGVGLIVAELFVSAFGVLFVLGLGCMLVGGSLLFDMPEVSDLGVSFWSVLVPVVGGFGVFAAIVVVAVGRTIMTGQTAGVSELIGMIGRVSTRLAPDGKVFIRGEYWNASADEEIAEDERVEVTAVEGLRMRVRRVVAGR